MSQSGERQTRDELLDTLPLDEELKSSVGQERIMLKPFLFCLISVSFYLLFLRYCDFSDSNKTIGRYLFEYTDMKKLEGEIKTNDLSETVEEKSSVVSKYGLDFELFYNVRNALRILSR